MTDTITTSVRDSIAWVALNRPDKHNALSPDMFEGLAAAGAALQSRDDIVAVVLHGNGKSFCSGLDFQSFVSDPTLLQKAFTKPADSPANFAQLPAYVWRELDVPVIAAITGNCFGGGLQIALGADLRIAAPDAKLSVMEVRWGLVPDMCATQTLRDIVRLDVAKELAFSGRIVAADEAERLGLVTRIADDPLAAAEALTQEMRKRSPDALRAIKRLFNNAWHVGAEEGLQQEAAAQQQLLGRPNQLEAVRANVENRAPVFEIGASTAPED